MDHLIYFAGRLIPRVRKWYYHRYDGKCLWGLVRFIEDQGEYSNSTSAPSLTPEVFDKLLKDIIKS